MCAQGCHNLEGSYQCVCVRKFKLADDNHSCEVVRSHEEPMMLFTTRDAIHKIDLISESMDVVVQSDVSQMVGVGYDGKMIYYSDMSKHVEKIMRVRPDGKKKELVLSAGLLLPEDIAIDYYTGNLYFTDFGHMHIGVCSNDGFYCMVLISQELQQPRGIVLFPQRGQLYWSDWGKKPYIGLANMDGTASRQLVENIGYPSGLTLDWPNERLYWIDEKRKTIESIRLDGTDRRQVLKNLKMSPYGIAVFGNRVYWSDRAAKSIQYCDKFTGKHRQNLIVNRDVYGMNWR